MEISISGPKDFYLSIYHIAQEAREKGLVFYGAGFWGDLSAQIFSLLGVEPSCFCDDDPEKIGRFYNDRIPVLSFEESKRRYSNAVWIATVNSDTVDAPRKRLNNKLRENGLLSASSGFHPVRYLYLLEEAGILKAITAEPDESPDRFHACALRRMVILNHMANSGCVYFDNLVDGHPDLLNITLLGHYIPLQEVYQKRLRFLEDEPLVAEVASQMSPYLQTRFPEKLYEKMFYRAAQHYLVNDRGEPENRMYLPVKAFVRHLSTELMGKGRISYAYLLKAIFAAYYNTLGKKYDASRNYWIFYQRHKENYDMKEIAGLLSPGDFDAVKYLFIVREPVQHFFSWMNRFVLRASHDTKLLFGRANSYLNRLRCGMGLMLQNKTGVSNDDVRVVRFEDVKQKHRGLMEAFCRWLGIEYDSILEETTVNGIQIYFPVAGKAGAVITGNEQSAVNKKDYSELLSAFDIVRLKIVFQQFSHAYRYACDVPDFRLFARPFREELFDYPFRFEQTLDEACAMAYAVGGAARGDEPRCGRLIRQLFSEYMDGYEDVEYYPLLAPEDI